MIFEDTSAPNALLLADSSPPHALVPHPMADEHIPDPEDDGRILAFVAESCGCCGATIATRARSVPMEHADDLPEAIGEPIVAELPVDGDPCPACAYDLDVPAWVDVDSLPVTPDAGGVIYGEEIAEMRGWLRDLAYGGCASGMYMPAVTEAATTMAEHGDDVLIYIEDYGELPTLPQGESWSGIAVFYLSYAVESWGLSTLSDLEA